MQVILYKQDNGNIAVMAPATNSGLSVEQVAQKDVPTGKPYLICDVSELPQDVPQEAWVIDDAEFTTGVGA